MKSKSIAMTLSFIFVFVAFAPAYAQTQYNNPFLEPFIVPSSKDKILLFPPSPPHKTINDNKDLVAPETFVEESGRWSWKYEGYILEGLLPPIVGYWMEKTYTTSCYVPVFFSSYDYFGRLIVIRLSRSSVTCGENRDELLKEYISGKYIKATITYYALMGNPKEHGYIEIILLPL